MNISLYRWLALEVKMYNITALLIWKPRMSIHVQVQVHVYGAFNLSTNTELPSSIYQQVELD